MLESLTDCPIIYHPCELRPGPCSVFALRYCHALIPPVRLIQREFPVCEGGGESKILRSRTSPARNQLRTTPVKAWESCAGHDEELRGGSPPRAVEIGTASLGQGVESDLESEGSRGQSEATTNRNRIGGRRVLGNPTMRACQVFCVTDCG
jgi:hypothetical protein